MQTLSLGDLSQSLILNRHSARLKAGLQTLSSESTTGMAADQTARGHDHHGHKQQANGDVVALGPAADNRAQAGEQARTQQGPDKGAGAADDDVDHRLTRLLENTQLGADKPPTHR